MRKRKPANRTPKKANQRKKKPTANPHVIWIVDECGTPSPTSTKLKDKEQVVFKIKPTVQTGMHIEFGGDPALFEQNGNGAGPQDIDSSHPGRKLTGKCNGPDLNVTFEITPATPCDRPHLRKGNGTIKVGQTLASKSRQKRR